MASECSGVPINWTASTETSGIFVLPGLYSEDAVNDALLQLIQPEDGVLTTVSIHWGPNWAYRYGIQADGQNFSRKFALKLI